MCPNCKGNGRIQRINRSSFGTFVQVVPCPTCRGKGSIIDTPCPKCKGTGLIRRQRSITIRVPPGIDEGYQLRLQGQGEASRDGNSPGDLYVMIHIAPHPYFKRDEDDLLYELKIGFPQAALGTRVTIPGLDGKVDVDIPSGTQPGEIIRLKGRGMPKFRRYGRGDLLLRVGVEVPEKLTGQQRALLEELAKEFDQNVRPKSHRLRL
jgi:molecular chaperone DnaJ